MQPVPTPRPDAIRFSKASGVSLRHLLEQSLSSDEKEKLIELHEFTEHHLKCGPAESAYLRDQGNEYYATRDPEDTINVRLGQPNAGEPRYCWLDQGKGLFYGYLRETHGA